MPDTTPNAHPNTDEQMLTLSQDLFWEDNFNTLAMSFAERENIRQHIPEGVELLVSEKNVPNLSFNGTFLYEKADPIASAKRQVDQINADDDTSLVVIMGLGLGYHAEHLERRFDCPIIIYEPNLSIAATTLGRRPLPLSRTIVCTTIPSLLVHTQTRLQFRDRKMVVAAIMEYQKLFPENFQNFKNSVHQAVGNAQILENTTAMRSSDWVYHAAQNLPIAAAKPTVECLGDRFESRPGILVSAGPSLDKNIEDLKAAKGRAFIIAVNAAAKPLEKAGIKPDMIAVVEGLDLREQLAEIAWIKDIVLAPTINCFPGFFTLKSRHLFPIADYSIAASDWFSIAYKWQQMPSGGSVACTAFSILYTIGCDPIILMGQDLAYTNGQSYTKTATFGSQTMQYDTESKRLKMVDSERNSTIEDIRKKSGLALLDNMDAMEVDAWGGNGKVYTATMFSLFNTWFETSAQGWAKDRTLINATEGGARIKGFEEMSLKQAIEAHCHESFNAAQLIDEAVTETPPNDIHALINVIEKELEIINQLKDLAENGKTAAARAIDVLDNRSMAEADHDLRYLAAIEKRIGALSRKSRTIEAFLSGKINKLRAGRFEDRDTDKIRQSQNALRRAIALFDVIQDGAVELLTLYRPVISKMSTQFGESA